MTIQGIFRVAVCSTFMLCAVSQARASVTVTVTQKRGTDNYVVKFSRSLAMVTQGSSPQDLIKGLQKHFTVIDPDSVIQSAEDELSLSKQDWTRNGYRYIEECEFAKALYDEIRASSGCRDIKWKWPFDPCGWRTEKKVKPCQQQAAQSRRGKWYARPRLPWDDYNVPRAFTASERYFYIKKGTEGVYFGPLYWALYLKVYWQCVARLPVTEPKL